MELALIEILESFKYPVFRQGTMGEHDVYPETFITFWCNDSPDNAYYDNDGYGTSWSFSVYIYSADPELAYTLTNEVREALKTDGWKVPSKGYDVSSGEPTHVAKGLDILYAEF